MELRYELMTSWMAKADHDYKAGYQLVYPIKVNQQRQVVEEVLRFGSPFKFGLEAGSKPELLAVVAMTGNDVPIVCNGFKDDRYIEMAMLARRIGRQIFVVVEKYTDLGLILRYAEEIGVRPLIGRAGFGCGVRRGRTLGSGARCVASYSSHCVGSCVSPRTSSKMSMSERMGITVSMP